MEIETCTPDRLPLRRLDWARLLPCLGEAREALGRYDEALKRTPPEILEILKWRECLSSLRGQSIQADLKEWLLFCIDGTGEESRTALLQKITHVFDALNAAIRLAKNEPFNGRIFSQIHAIVKQDAANPDEIGKIRKRQNWIGPQGAGIDQAYFFPPEAKKVRSCIQSLSRYLRGKEKDPLVQLAVFFAQFLIIHPFMDGNGRVARILIPVILWKKKTISEPLFFMSRYFEDHRLDYFRKLFSISDKGKWEEWILYFLRGVIEQADRLKGETEAIRELYLKIASQCGEKEACKWFRKPLVKKTPSKSRKYFVRSKKGFYFFEPLFKITK